MKKLNVLHLASFDGNIGDNANHDGVRRLLGKTLDAEISYTDLEMREFFWGTRKFDLSFAELANRSDLLIVGGGNYFELWVERSATGTSVDFSPELLEAIRTPILFNGLGCDAEKGAPEENLVKFRSFLDTVCNSDRYLVSVRNDGSKDTIRKYVGSAYAERVHRIPDGGFFLQVRDHEHPELSGRGRTIAISLAGDMPDIRYGSGAPAAGSADCGSAGSRISYQRFLKEFSSLMNRLLEEDPQLDLVFVPHIFRDLSAISDALDGIKDEFRRRRVTVAPYLHGMGAQEVIFDLYAKCDLILGVRFHANVCGIGLNVPTIGLVNYPKIEYLYSELGMSDRTVRVNQAGFAPVLENLIRDSLANPRVIKERYMQKKADLLSEINAFHQTIGTWLERLL